MPLRTDFTSGLSQGQDDYVPTISGEQVDNSLVKLHNAFQRGVSLFDEEGEDQEEEQEGEEEVDESDENRPETTSPSQHGIVDLMTHDAMGIMEIMFPNRFQDITLRLDRAGAESVAYTELSGDRVASGRGAETATALYRLINELRTHQPWRSMTEISAMFRDMFPEYVSHRISAGQVLKRGSALQMLRVNFVPKGNRAGALGGIS